MNQFTDENIVKWLKKSNREVLQHVFDLYYEAMCRYAIKLIGSAEQAEEIAQDVIVYLWENRKKLCITTSLRGYIFTSVRNACFNYSKSKFAKQTFVEIDNELLLPTTKENSELETKELTFLLETAIRLLPEKCRLVYCLSRNSDYTYKQIASELNISAKTVENQMSIALKRIRQFLEKHYYTIVVIPVLL